MVSSGTLGVKGESLKMRRAYQFWQRKSREKDLYLEQLYSFGGQIVTRVAIVTEYVISQ